MKQITADFWRDVLLSLAIVVVVLALLAGALYEDYHPAPKPCPTAHRMCFPIATPLDAHPHLTDQDLQGWYETYRRMYFGKDLPDAKVFWTDLPEGLMGQTNRTPEGNFEIRIDRKANPAQKEALMTLLHEMCHVDMWAFEFDDHGKMWQFDMHRLADEDAFEDLW